MALLKLEAFAGSGGEGGPQPETPEAQQQRLEAWEAAYQNGWDDATNARTTTEARMSDEVARNLKALSLSFQEAQAQMLRSVAPLLEAVVGHILPDLARRLLVPAIVDVLMPLAERATGVAVRITVHPADMPGVSAFLSSRPDLTVALREDAGLSRAEAVLCAGDEEIRLDPGAAAARIATLVRDFLAMNGDRPDG